MVIRIALDTNILTYAEGVGDKPRCKAARELIDALPENAVVLPVQVLGELHRVLTGKLKRAPNTVRQDVLRWSDAFPVADSTWSAIAAAFDLVADHGLQIWDALILAVAAEQRCRILLSEDLQHGFTWRGVSVVNPFASPRHALLASVFSPEHG